MESSRIQPNPCSEKNPDDQTLNSSPLTSAEIVELFLGHLGISQALPEAALKENFAVKLVNSALKLETAERGQVSFSLTVSPQFTNYYNTLHGGAVGVIAVAAAQACVMTVAGDKEFFLGESNVSYLSASRINEDVAIEGHVLREGRNVLVVSLEFKSKKTNKLIYAGHFTFYAKPVAKL